MSQQSSYLERSEVRAIMSCIPLVSRFPDRDVLLAETMWQSGGRVTEVITLTPEHIGMTSLILSNLKQRKAAKGEDGRALRDGSGHVIRVPDPDAVKEVEVSGVLCAELKKFCQRNNIGVGQYVFRSPRGGHVGRTYVWSILDRASTAAGVFRFGKRNPRTGGRYKGAYPHHFRHSNAMFLLDQTGDISLVKEQLGHANIQTTEGYAHIKRPKLRREIAKIEF